MRASSLLYVVNISVSQNFISPTNGNAGLAVVTAIRDPDQVGEVVAEDGLPWLWFEQ